MQYTHDKLDTRMVVGQLIRRNVIGKAAIFLEVQEKDELIRVFIKHNHVGPEVFESLQQLEMGDLLWARGTMVPSVAGGSMLQVHEIASCNHLKDFSPTVYSRFESNRNSHAI